MTELSGKLKGKSTRDFSGYVVHAVFEEIFKTSEDGEHEVLATAMRRGDVNRRGEFSVTILPAGERTGPIHLKAIGPDGVVAGEEVLHHSTDGADLEIEVDATTPTPLDESDVQGLGSAANFRGRLISKIGEAAPNGIVIVLRGKPVGEETFAVVDILRTTGSGYFAGALPVGTFTEAHASAGALDPVPIDLVGGRLPERFVVVVDSLPEAEEKPEDCDCPDSPPIPVDSRDLAENSEVYSTDIGGCVDFTVPNRTVEEVVYQAVVRTTQPELNPPDPPPRPTIPPGLLEKFARLADIKPKDLAIVTEPPPTGSGEGGTGAAPAVPMIVMAQPVTAIPAAATARSIPASDTREDVITPALGQAAALTPGIDLSGVFIKDVAYEAPDNAAVVLRNRLALKKKLSIDPAVVQELANDNRPISANRLLAAEQKTVLSRIRNDLKRLSNRGFGRFDLSESRQVEWDQVPDRYQATTIAHGHLLSIKQVWKSDGYSLGDLLYSLPLAPGQQKLISVVDWDRREVTERRASRVSREEVRATLARDRDVSDVIRSNLDQNMRASSRANVASASAAIGGFVGAVVFGASGGVSTASSSASQTSARSVTGQALNQVRDRTLQSASAVRSQRATVVQTARQGESVRAQTEVVVNYNRCHAITIEYFEVLRHLQVSQELAQVQECLFIPLSISAFSGDKALRWRDALERALRRRRYSAYFRSLDRVEDNWASVDLPAGRYADDPIRHLSGELRMRISLPKPADGEDGVFSVGAWEEYDESLLGQSALDLWEKYFGGIPENRRQRVWDTRVAPAIAQRLVSKLRLKLHPTAGDRDVEIDPTMVSRYRDGRAHLVSIRLPQPITEVTRASVERVELYFDSTAALPPGAEIHIDSATMSYRTDHYNGTLFRDRRILNDLSLRESGDDTVQIATPLSGAEKRDPRLTDRRRAEKLLDHLNEFVEYYHRAIWMEMDPNRRYLLLDGYEAPNAGGRSVASVVENRILGIVGNSLVMPVAPGQKLDPTYEFAESTPEDLRHLYAVDSAPKARISLPTPGVFAEAVMGKCNSCEKIDNSRFWQFEEFPLPDTPTPISAASTDTRRSTPVSTAPDAFTEALVKYQQVPGAPAPQGMAAAMKAIGTGNTFKDITGLDVNQANSVQAYQATMKVAQQFASHGAALSKQKFLSKELDRNLDTILKAYKNKQISKKTMQKKTGELFKRAIGKKDDGSESPSKSEAVQAFVEEGKKANKSQLRVERGSGSIELDVKNASGPIDVRVDPSVAPLKQRNPSVCWATAGLMMSSWEARASTSMANFLQGLGGDWAAREQSDSPLTPGEFKAFAGALGLVEEGPQSYSVRGIASLLEHGPLAFITDDVIENNVLAHVRVVTGITGDGSADGTRVIVIDSAEGTQKPVLFSDFSELYSADDAMETGLGVFHYP